MHWITKVVGILIAQAAGGIGGYFTASKIPTWFVTLVKPTWQPPSWVFGPVWTTLFLLMGYASALVWDRRGQSPLAKAALIAYAVQLALNVLWSYLFFGLQSPGAAFAEIIVLTLAIIVTLVLFRRVSPIAGWLLVPYLAWALFASYLNYTIWRLNA